jgi:exodeoxyribonuclease VII small subunit
MPDQTDITTMTYEQAFAELESVVASLESNQGSLAEATALFERGQLLAGHCANLLEQAALKVSELTGGNPPISSLTGGSTAGSPEEE